jgi:ribA/ribD-fused uncharacterized protein
VLSNFSAFKVKVFGELFDTSEAAYHWAKFDEPNSVSRAIQVAILEATSAHEAFKLAEKYKSLVRSNWKSIRVKTMRTILNAKVDQHEYVRRKLLATETRELIEDSWRDDFWGWGPNKDGQNQLGKLWMEIRSEVREQHIVSDEWLSNLKLKNSQHL